MKKVTFLVITIISLNLSLTAFSGNNLTEENIKNAKAWCEYRINVLTVEQEQQVKEFGPIASETNQYIIEHYELIHDMLSLLEPSFMPSEQIIAYATAWKNIKGKNERQETVADAKNNSKAWLQHRIYMLILDHDNNNEEKIAIMQNTYQLLKDDKVYCGRPSMNQPPAVPCELIFVFSIAYK